MSRRSPPEGVTGPLVALDKGTDYRSVVADEADSARIFKRIMKLSSGMGDFVNGELTEGL